MKNKAFTLAEVLITLVIIGVIVSMTIPTLINKTQNQEFVSRLKKTYSTFAQVTNRIIAENGTPDNWHLKGSRSYDEASENFGKLYQKYLSSAKQCKSGQRGCFSSVVKDMAGNTNCTYNDSSNYYRLLLSDGSTVLFDGNIFDDCTIGSMSGCSYFFVDVNGEKGPNVAGRDVFQFFISKNGLQPAGINNDGISPTSKCSQNNLECTWKVLLENAMNY